MKNLSFAAVACLFLAGCAQEPDLVTEVTGVVNFDGKPLADANVLFWPRDIVKGCATRSTDEEGLYVVNPDATYERLAQGAYVVVVTKFVRPDGSPLKVDWTNPMTVVVPNSLENPPGTRNVVPNIYRTNKTSPLEITFAPGANAVPVELHSKVN